MVRWLPFSATYPQLVLGVLVCAMTVAILVGALTSGVAFGSYNIAWDGTSELRAEADSVGEETVIATDTERYETIDANGTTAFVIGPAEQYDTEDSNRVRSFVERGGTVVIADDQPARANALLEDLDSTVRIDGDPVRDERTYHRSPALPRATEIEDNSLAETVDGLTLNHGTVLDPGDATVLVRTSEFAYVDRNRNEELDDDETLAAYPIVAAEDRGAGRIIVVSDSSVLINAMIDRPDNRAFVRSLIDSERVVIDTTHGDEIPPLAGMLLAIRTAPTLQFIVGLGAVTLVAVWSMGGLGPVSRRIAAVFGSVDRSRSSDPHLDPPDVRTVIDAGQFDLDESDRERLTTAVINQRDDSITDDGSSSSSRRDQRRDGTRPDR